MINDYMDNTPDAWMTLLIGLSMWGHLKTDTSQEDVRPVDSPKPEPVYDEKKITKLGNRHLICDSKESADKIVATMLDIIKLYRVATRADFYGCAGLSSDRSDSMQGWTDLTSKGSSIWIDCLSDGSYLITMPPVTEVDLTKIPSNTEHDNVYFIHCLDRADAERVMMNLIDIVDCYGFVTVADANTLIKRNVSIVDAHFGWKDLAEAKIEESNRNVNLPGGVSKYRIRLPIPKRIN